MIIINFICYNIMKLTIKAVNSNYFNQPNVNLFIDIVFNNFKYLLDDPELKHDKNNIKKLLMSNKLRGLLMFLDTKIMAYLLGEIMILADGRKAFYITYLFVSPMYRKKGFASTLLDNLLRTIGKNNFDTIVLTVDTNNKPVHNFYLKKGYMPDLLLRRYGRFEVLSLAV